MSRSSGTRRSRTRRVGESAFGVLLVLKNALMALLVLLLLLAGAWTSWESARPAMFESAGERGTLTVQGCTEDRCTGEFVPPDGGVTRNDVAVAASVAEDEERLPVALLPGGAEAVRTGVGGVLYAWVPLAGGLLLASLVLAGGLRMRRTAWVAGLSGAGVMVGAHLLL